MPAVASHPGDEVKRASIILAVLYDDILALFGDGKNGSGSPFTQALIFFVHDSSPRFNLQTQQGVLNTSALRLSRGIFLRLSHRELREIVWALKAPTQVIQPTINGNVATAAGSEFMAVGALNNVAAVVALDRVPDDPPPVGLYRRHGFP